MPPPMSALQEVGQAVDVSAVHARSPAWGFSSECVYAEVTEADC